MRIEVDSHRLEVKLQNLASGSGQLALNIVNRLTQAGVEYSKMLAQSDSGEMRGLINAQPATLIGGEAVGSWSAGSDHAPYVEYGTGAPGAAGQVANGQPRNPKAAGFTYTLQTVVHRRKVYVRKDGKLIPLKDYIIKGWIYYDTVRQRFVHTLGQPAQPFMYPALLKIQQQAGRIAAEVMREVIRG